MARRKRSNTKRRNSNRRSNKRSNSNRRSRRNEMRKLIQKIPKKKLTKLIQGRVFGDDIKQQLSIVKEMPEKYFTMDELIKYSKKKRSRKRKIGGSGVGRYNKTGSYFKNTDRRRPQSRLDSASP